MKTILHSVLALVVVVGVSGCYARTAQGPLRSNQEILLANAEQAGRLVASSPILASARKVAIASLERPDVSDFAVQAEIEDALHHAMSLAGIRTVERDPDVLVRLAYQEGTQFLEYLVLAHVDGQPVRYDPRSMTLVAFTGADSHVVLFESGPVTGHIPIPAHSFDAERPFHAVPTEIAGRRLSELASADYIVAYRVLEHGVQYRDAHRAQYGPRLLRRHVLTRLHVRILEAKTGIVQFARTLEYESHDDVPASMRPSLERPVRRNHHPATLPMQDDLPARSGSVAAPRAPVESPRRASVLSPLAWLRLGAVAIGT